MSISIATFAYVGVEVIAACALEAQWPGESADEHTEPAPETPKDTLIGTTVKFSAIFIPVLATVAYTLSGVLGSIDISEGDCHLPRLSWLPDKNCTGPAGTGTGAAFVLIAAESEIPYLADVFNAFLVFTCLSCAGTSLYIASRTLFGLTSRLEGGRGGGKRWLLRGLAWFGKTNRHNVPLRAMIFSAVAFWWVPFLQLIGGRTRSSINAVRNYLNNLLLSKD
jgi:amino acid transporter